MNGRKKEISEVEAGKQQRVRKERTQANEDRKKERGERRVRKNAGRALIS